MLWDTMNIDEFAAFQRTDGNNVVKSGDVWWVEIRPFFFRPLFPFTEIDPSSHNYPLKSLLGGVLHLAPSSRRANSRMHFFIYDDLQSYSLDALSNKRKKITMQGVDKFTLKEFKDVDQFVAVAYEVYLSFFSRTQYWYRSERTEKKFFEKWAATLFAQPKVVKVGAFCGDQLCGVEVSYRVGDVIVGDTLFSNELGKRLNVTDFILHRLREAAAKTDASYFYLGLPSGVHSLDESKLIRGCKVMTRPALLKVNPVALSVAKVLMKSSYQKLLDITAPALPTLCYRPDSKGTTADPA
jgi:hypothetical protein